MNIVQVYVCMYAFVIFTDWADNNFHVDNNFIISVVICSRLGSVIWQYQLLNSDLHTMECLFLVVFFVNFTQVYLTLSSVKH